MLAGYPDSPKLERKSSASDSEDDERERKSSYCSLVEIRLRDRDRDRDSDIGRTETKEARSDAREREYRCGEASEMETVEESGLPDGIRRQPALVVGEQRDRRSVTGGGRRSSMSSRRMSTPDTLEPIVEQKASPAKQTSKTFYI